MIDDCASGGRRIDLETIGRSTALSRTDFVFDLLANQCHSYGLLHWVPLHTTSAGNLSTKNNYRIRSSMTAGVGYGLFSQGDTPQPKTNVEGFPFSEVKRSLEQFRGLQKYFHGDFYPLTEYTQALDAWLAYQLDLPGQGEGLVVVLKRPGSNYTQSVYQLNGLAADSLYAVTNLDSGESASQSGRQLMDKGLEVQLRSKPDSAVFSYRRKP